MKESDSVLKKELRWLAMSGAPRPRANTRLGRALIRFTTAPLHPHKAVERLREFAKDLNTETYGVTVFEIAEGLEKWLTGVPAKESAQNRRRDPRK